MMTKALALRNVIEEILAPAMAIADTEAKCSRLARTLRVDLVNGSRNSCARVVQSGPTPAGTTDWEITRFLFEVVELAVEALEGSPYALTNATAEAVALQSVVAVSWDR
jgi:hypothetical protein